MNNKIATWQRLGYKNIMTVAIYRVLKKSGYYRFRLPIVKSHEEPLFSKISTDKTDRYCVDYFSFHTIITSSPPHWFLNPWANAPDPKNKKGKNTTGDHWSDIPDFMPELGDIKLVWELSRFDWLPKMAWEYRQGNKKALPLLELWLRDWVVKNPVNSGINWKCGQEASLRCLNLLASSLMINNSFNKPSEGLLSLLEVHATRIEPTLRYAMAQDNNHGTSEAAALFVVGEYFIKQGSAKQQKSGIKWAKKGRFWLENRIKKLIMDDGSFSQHSVTYHRLLLDSLSFVELFRDHLQLKKFSALYYKKIEQASQWLYDMIDNTSGNAPNLGANDGAYLFNVENTEYRDFRPSVQLSTVVFLKKSVNDHTFRHPLLTLFNINTQALPSPLKKPQALLLSHGGYAFLRKEQGFAMMRLPVYKFRPSHADAHHIDIWHKGKNIIRDGGTYSYNTNDELRQFFSGTQSHSTVQFDNRDQMPRLGRFLFANWLTPHELALDKYNNRITSSYLDAKKVFHRRVLLNTQTGWQVTDTFEGFTSQATLRWRLSVESWALEGNRLTSKNFSIDIKSNAKLSLKLLEAEESLYYMDKTMIPILEITCKEFGSIESIFTLH